MSGPQADAFAAPARHRRGAPGRRPHRGRPHTDERHANPHSTVHGAVFYAVAGAAVAAAANDDESSGIISSVLVEYLQPAALGDQLYAEVAREVTTGREDIFTGTVRRGAAGRPAGLGAGPAAPTGPAPD